MTTALVQVEPNGEVRITTNGTALYPCYFTGTTTGTTATAVYTTSGTWITPTSTTGTASTGIYWNGTPGTFVVCSNGYVESPGQAEARRAREAQWRREEARRRAASERKAKGAIKRALKLIDGVGFGKDVRVFLGGEEVEVSHPDSQLKFVIQKYRGSLIDRTVRPGYSTPYELSLYTKCNVHVADLCVYMKDTPVLDQVLALAMFVKSGNEEMILRQANWRYLTDDMETCEILALEYPYLEDKLRLNRTSIRGRIAPGYIESSAIVSAEPPNNFEVTA